MIIYLASRQCSPRHRPLVHATVSLVSSVDCHHIAWRASFTRPNDAAHFKLSVGGTSPSYLLEIEGLFTHGSRRGRTVGESAGETFETDSSDWLNGIRCHTFGTRPDAEFKLARIESNAIV